MNYNEAKLLANCFTVFLYLGPYFLYLLVQHSFIKACVLIAYARDGNGHGSMGFDPWAIKLLRLWQNYAAHEISSLGSLTNKYGNDGALLQWGGIVYEFY